LVILSRGNLFQRLIKETMNIRVLGAHNCEFRDSRFVCLLIDDVLAIDAGALSSSLSFEEQRELRAILLTHQHYDHIRDVPAIAINRSLNNATINIYSTKTVHDALASHLLNGGIYPKFMEWPEVNPAVRFITLKPRTTKLIEGYNVLTIPVNHNDSTVGYQVTSSDGKSVFYTSDTGAGLATCWESISPQLLIVEVTAPNRYEDFAIKSGHLTPALLNKELTDFRELKSYLPPIVVVHMNPRLEEEIKAEVIEVSEILGTSIILANEGMELHL